MDILAKLQQQINTHNTKTNFTKSIDAIRADFRKTNTYQYTTKLQAIKDITELNGDEFIKLEKNSPIYQHMKHHITDKKSLTSIHH